MLFNYSLVSVFLGICVYAQIVPDPLASNITIAFFTETEEPACKGHNIANSIALTTNNIPEAYTCFGLLDIFSQTSNYSHRDIRSSAHNQTMNYTLGNVASYTPGNNYTRVWYHLGWPNPKGKNEDGEEWSPWTFTAYSFPNFSTVNTGNGGDSADDLKENPWFGVSCRRKEGGECKVTLKPIKSFAIYQSPIDQEDRKCADWAKYLQTARR
ncbi:hypothetical protein BKA64DRAFT_646728 [Cadophora sp. MPI-SDFR-AT-0126]|nr:hypothetical protein BKA64DRAFT_646728 [Leotiomycetes sp. MPI-SDFR-AT-0126]